MKNYVFKRSNGHVGSVFTGGQADSLWPVMNHVLTDLCRFFEKVKKRQKNGICN